MDNKYTKGLLMITTPEGSKNYVLGKVDCDNYQKLRTSIDTVHLNKDVKEARDKLKDIKYIRYSSIHLSSNRYKFHSSEDPIINFHNTRFKNTGAHLAKSIKVSGDDITILFMDGTTKSITSSNFSILYDEKYSSLLKSCQLTHEQVRDKIKSAIDYYNKEINKREKEYEEGIARDIERYDQWAKTFPNNVLLFMDKIFRFIFRLPPRR